MREYKIKRGHIVNLDVLISKFFSVEGRVEKGINFEVNGIGVVDIKLENKFNEVNSFLNEFLVCIVMVDFWVYDRALFRKKTPGRKT